MKLTFYADEDAIGIVADAGVDGTDVDSAVGEGEGGEGESIMVAISREEVDAIFRVIGRRGGQTSARRILHPQLLRVAPPGDVARLSSRVSNDLTRQIVCVTLVYR